MLVSSEELDDDPKSQGPWKKNLLDSNWRKGKSETKLTADVLREDQKTRSVRENVCVNQTIQKDLEIFAGTSLSSQQTYKYHSCNDTKEDEKERKKSLINK